jgi:thiamine-monophosphate kinase
MQLRQIGELKLLQKIRQKFSVSGSGIVAAIGDDAAVITAPSENIIVTTDMMNEGIHFDLSFCSPYHIGFKLVSVNISDIMAMGGKPAYLLLDIAVKPDTDDKWFDELYEGISASMDLYGASLLGGDLCSAKNDMAFAATAIGFGKSVVMRGGASVGDKIYVTGTLGDSSCGLAILQRLRDESRVKVKELKFGVEGENKKGMWNEFLSLTHDSKIITLNWPAAEPLLFRHLMPVARDSSEIAKTATAMIDISDGLFIDLGRLCDESSTGARIYLDRLPMSDNMKEVAEVLDLDALKLATSGGEDYELLFTAQADMDISGLRVACIGEIIAQDRIVVDQTGRQLPLKSEGYEHF